MTQKLEPITVDVEELLGANKYTVDDGNPHIELKGDINDISEVEFGKLVRVCPAALYKEDDEGRRRFDWAGCLECGTCRIACEDTIIEKWDNPAPLMGIEYRYG